MTICQSSPVEDLTPRAAVAEAFASSAFEPSTEPPRGAAPSLSLASMADGASRAGCPAGEALTRPLKAADLREGIRRRGLILQARQLRQAGSSWPEVARATGIAAGTIHRWANDVAHIADDDLTAAHCAPQTGNSGRRPTVDFIADDLGALRNCYAITNRAEARDGSKPGSVQEAVRMALRMKLLSPALETYVRAREAMGAATLLPESLHRKVLVAAATVQRIRSPRNADLDLNYAPGSMMWLKDEEGDERFVRVGDIIEADDATINFIACIPWESGGCEVSESWGVKVGRFQWLVSIDASSRFVPGWIYTARPRDSYRAEDILSLLNIIFRAHGAPRVCRFEGGTFASNAVERALALLHVELRTVHSPHSKPFIEGLFNKIWTKLSYVPGQVGRFRGEMEEANKLFARCKTGSTDPRLHFPMLKEVVDAFDTVIAEHNRGWVHSRNYGKWIPAERWKRHHEASAQSSSLSPQSSFRPVDRESLWMLAPCVREWRVEGSTVGGMVKLMDDYSAKFVFGASWLHQFDGCRVKCFFDPHAGEDECQAMIVLASSERDHVDGEPLGFAPQINKMVRYARSNLALGLDRDLGVQHRAQVAHALTRVARSVMPAGSAKPAPQIAETRDGLGNAAKLEISRPVAAAAKAVDLPSPAGRGKGEGVPAQDSALSAQDSRADARAARRRAAAIANQLREEAETL